MKILFVLLILVIGITVYLSAKKKRIPYIPAEAKFEGGGIMRGLTAPEAAAVVGKPIHKIIGLALMGLIRKGFVEIEPGSQLIITAAKHMRTREISMDIIRREELRRQSAQAVNQVLYPYEELFLEFFEQEAGKPVVDLDFSILVKPFVQIVAHRMGGYSIDETREYYNLIIARAPKETRAGGVLVADHDKVFATNLLWILLHEERKDIVGDYKPDWVNQALIGETSLFMDWVEGIEEILKNSIGEKSLEVKLGKEIDEVSARIISEIAKATYTA